MNCLQTRPSSRLRALIALGIVFISIRKERTSVDKISRDICILERMSAAADLYFSEDNKR